MSRPVGWLRQRTAGCAAPPRRAAVISARGIRWPPWTLACTQSSSARTSSGRSSRPSGRMSHSIPRRTRNGASALVGGGDLLALAADVVGGQAAHGADGRRVVADREVVVAALARGAAHLLDARAAVRPGRVAVQVAADVGELDERRRLAAERRLAQLRRAPRQPERARRPPPRRARPAAARAPRRTRPSRSRARSAVPKRSGSATTQLDRHALDGHPDRAPLALLDHRDDLRQRGEARRAPAPGPARRRRPRAARSASRQRRASPAGSPPSAAAIAADELPRPVEQQPARRPRLGLARERLEQPRLGLRPDARARSRSRPAAAASRNSSGVRTPSARAISTERFASARGSGRGRRARARARARARRSSAISPVSTQLAQPRLDPRADPAQLAHAPGRARARRPAPARRGSSRRPGGRRAAVYGFASASSSSAANASSRSAIRALSTAGVCPSTGGVRAAVMHAFGEPLALEASPTRARADGALVGVRATGLCRSDWHGWMGHDAAIALPARSRARARGGREAVGAEVARLAPGDRVTAPFCCGCGAASRAGRATTRSASATTSPASRPGARSPSSSARPGRRQPRRAARRSTSRRPRLGCRFITAYRAVAQVGRVRAGDWVAVHGCGGVGLSAVMIAAAAGARVVASTSPGRARAGPRARAEDAATAGTTSAS